MVIHNASFMMEREKENEFLTWLREEIAQLGSLENPRLTSMREAGGVDYLQAETQSVAFQTEFRSVAEAREWSGARFATLAGRFEERFGPQAMVFTSIFEVLPL